MKHHYDHIDPHSNPGDFEERFFRETEIPYKETREEIWAKLEEKLDSVPRRKIFDFRTYRLQLGMAAGILLLAGTFSLLRFYTDTVVCPAGRHLSYVFPDGSSVEMNADSKLSFKPLWWRVTRQLNFTGEGHFRVEKGGKFEVVSDFGRTEVLGTSFNIYSRDDEYKVTCFTGKVRVVSFSSKEAILSPDYEASIDAGGNIAIRKDIDTKVVQAWLKNRFNFTARPLVMVLNEIGRQFDVIITSKATLDYSYTGYFSKDKPLEEVLALVCKPFGLTFVRISAKEYEILKN
jgi:ferric-dicitrate binding protein FerR (iron transport regulator)